MKIGIGIDTGGTCTDAVIYRFEDRKVLAWAKTATTKDDLAKGIAEALGQLPKEDVSQAEVIALSTTLATNACVENKGGRAKLIFFGVNPGNVIRTGSEYGLSTRDGTLIFVESKTMPDGQLVKAPDWEDFQKRIKEELQGCDAVGIVEMFAKKSGAKLEKNARRLIQENFDIPVVCGHELFAESNIIKRGASTLLNGRLISLIEEFVGAVKKALIKLDIQAPIVIVRSDGSLMSEDFAKAHPVETLLCGPVASVMGAVTLTDEQNCIVVDIGGTTTDIAFVKHGIPQKAEDGVHIGGWNTFVKGLFVDTFGLGGDSGVVLGEENQILIQEEKVIPICMAASAFPQLKKFLIDEEKNRKLSFSQREEVYYCIKDIGESKAYSKEEIAAANILRHWPMSLREAERNLDCLLSRRHIERLLREGIILRCGVTATDAMHAAGDFVKYDAEASKLALGRLAQIKGYTLEQLCQEIYDAVKEKLYSNLVRIMLEDSYPDLKKVGIGPQLAHLIGKTYEEKGGGESGLQTQFSTSLALVSVGAPTHLFLPDVGKRLGSKVVTPENAQVANAIGAIVGNVCAKVIVEVRLNSQDGSYTIFGQGERSLSTNLEEAKSLARDLAEKKAYDEAIARGASQKIKIKLDAKEDLITTDFGPVFMGYKVSAVAIGEMLLEKKEKDHEKRTTDPEDEI